MKRSIVFKCVTSVAHFLIVVCATSVFGAVPVEDRSLENRLGETRQPVQQNTQPQRSPGTNVGNPAGVNTEKDNRLSELFYQLQQLRQEVQTLRGLVEEQGYKLNRLSKDQKEQYLDLDQRVSSASRTGLNQSSTNGSPASAGSSSTNTGQAGTAPGAQSSSSNSRSNRERASYTDAFNLMKGQKFAESIVAFETLITSYPNGVYTPNSFYWLGEIHLATSELELSRQSFVQVINLFPGHQKVPDTLYKLGVVYHRLEDTQKAREYLQRVQTEHSNTPAASLAKSYAAELR